MIFFRSLLSLSFFFNPIYSKWQCYRDCSMPFIVFYFQLCIFSHGFSGLQNINFQIWIIASVILSEWTLFDACNHNEKKNPPRHKKRTRETNFVHVKTSVQHTQKKPNEDVMKKSNTKINGAIFAWFMELKRAVKQWIEWLSAAAYIYVCTNDPPIFWIRSCFVYGTQISVVEITVCYCILLLLLFDAIILYRRLFAWILHFLCS